MEILVASPNLLVGRARMARRSVQARQVAWMLGVRATRCQSLVPA